MEKRSNRRCLFGTWVSLEKTKDTVHVRNDDFSVKIELAGIELVANLGRRFLLNDYLERPDPYLFSIDKEDVNSNLIESEAVHYKLTSIVNDSCHVSEYPLLAYGEISKSISNFIKKRPKKIRGRAIKNEIQDAIINNWYSDKVTTSISKLIKAPLIEMASGLNFMTSAMYRKIKSNLGEKHLMRNFQQMNLLRFHCEDFRENDDFISDFLRYNILSHVFERSYLDEDFNVVWNYGENKSHDWRDMFSSDGHMCENKKFIIENMPRSIPSHIINNIVNKDFDKKLNNKSYIVFKSVLLESSEKAIDSLLGCNIFEMVDLQKSIKLYSEFSKNMIKVIPKKKYMSSQSFSKNKFSTRKTSTISSFAQRINESFIVTGHEKIEETGFCFSSLFDLTQSLCLEIIGAFIDLSSNKSEELSDGQHEALIKRTNSAIRLRDKFLLDHPDAIDICKDLNIIRHEPPPF